MRKREEVLQKFIEQKEFLKEKVNSGIEQNRKGYFKISLPDNLKGIKIKAVQKTHEFKFGANLFMLDEFETKEKNELYKKYFAEAFNMATLPFYWDDLEPEKGKQRYDKDSPKIYRRPATDLCIEFCEQNGIEPREHALAYDHFFPKWLYDADVPECKKEYERRCKEISERYGDKINTIEVTNEMFWGEGKTALYEEDNFIEYAFKVARKYFGSNQLVINEWVGFWNEHARTSDSYYSYIANAIHNGAPIDAIGMQYHMFFHADQELEKTAKYYNPKQLYKIMDLYSKFNKPLQLTEVTIPAYSNNEEDEALQAEIIKILYSIWFSHPNMEQIIYWNLVDGYAAFAPQGDMTSGENYYYGGLIRFDMTPKPAYYMVRDLFQKVWHTDAEITTDENGNAIFKGFYGKYDISFEVDGKTYTKEINCHKKGKNTFKIEL